MYKQLYVYYNIYNVYTISTHFLLFINLFQFILHLRVQNMQLHFIVHSADVIFVIKRNKVILYLVSCEEFFQWSTMSSNQQTGAVNHNALKIRQIIIFLNVLSPLAQSSIRDNNPGRRIQISCHLHHINFRILFFMTCMIHPNKSWRVITNR